MSHYLQLQLASVDPLQPQPKRVHLAHIADRIDDQGGYLALCGASLFTDHPDVLIRTDPVLLEHMCLGCIDADTEIQGYRAAAAEEWIRNGGRP